MRVRSTIATLILLLSATSCGDDGAAEDPTTTASTATTSTTTTSPPTTDATAAPTTTTAPTTTQGASAFAALEGFVRRAELLHVGIVDAATMFNESWESTGIVSPEAQAFIDDLDATHLRSHVPPGLAPDLEVAVLAVFADLDSRISALAGAVRTNEYAPDDVLVCLGLGGESFQRFEDDFTRMVELAATSPPPTAAPDSREAGILAVRLEAIQSMNWGCDSCGGVQYDAPIPVDWEAQTVFDGVEFESSFVDGAWEILIQAC